MSAELAARCTAAAAVDGDFRRAVAGYLERGGSVPHWQEWAWRLSSAVRSLTDELTAPGTAVLPGSLAALADWIDGMLGDERADRQVIAEGAMHALRELARQRPAALSPDALGVVGQALADAVAYRDPSGSCTGCEDHPAGLCEDHAADLDRADAYLALAAGLGIEVDR